MRAFIAFILFTLFGIQSQGQRKQLDSLFAAYPDFSGVVLVAEAGKPVYEKAFGFREFEGEKKLKKKDVFELASVSKQFTSMIIMMLKEKGLLDYNDFVEKYLDIPYKGISIRNLLTHTSGLPDYQEIMDKYWDKTKVAGNEDCIAYLNKYKPPMLFPTGTKYEYSNTGYLLLGSIAEKASGQNFIELCREWIFTPLKMKNTNLRTLEEKKATRNFALGHILVKERSKYIRADSFPASDYTIWLGNRKGPGRISSTAQDLLKWDVALGSGTLVSEATLSNAFMPMRLTDGSLSDYGFGWMLRADPRFGKIVYHTGSNPGYSTIIVRYLDKKKTVIMLNNNAHEEFNAILTGIESAID